MNRWKTFDNITGKFDGWDFSDYHNRRDKRHFDFYYWELYDWEFSPTKCIYEMSNSIIEPDDIVVDLGANIGLFTRLASLKSKRVISVEGSPEFFSCLVENTSDLKNINYLNANIVGETNKKSGTWSNNKSAVNITLKDLFYLYDLDHIDFLKVDIEGGEYNIFEDIDDFYLNKIRKISIETHNGIPNYNELNDILVNKFLKIDKNFFHFDWYYYSGQIEPQKMFYFY